MLYLFREWGKTRENVNVYYRYNHGRPNYIVSNNVTYFHLFICRWPNP